MPELPEVETIVRGLEAVLPHKIVRAIDVNKPKMWQGADQKILIGKAVQRVRRVAKILVFEFTGDLVLLVHLKMTGQLIYVDVKGEKIAGGHPDEQFLVEQPSKYTHIAFHFSDESTLYFNDMRQFGYAKLVENALKHLEKNLSKIGLDPFASTFTGNWLLEQLQKRPKTTVKQVLMDQSVIAGLGNIYTDESLFDAKILPTRRAASITADEARVLRTSIVKILTMGIQFGGTSYKDYVHHNGKKGTMQNHLFVYRRHGQACKVCGTLISRTALGGRGTHYCKTCQK